MNRNVLKSPKLLNFFYKFIQTYHNSNTLCIQMFNNNNYNNYNYIKSLLILFRLTNRETENQTFFLYTQRI